MTDSVLIAKLRKVLALTTSPVEGEAQAAAAHLQRLLTQHNLSIADLEVKGQAAPGIKEQAHDLGRAAFLWKMELAKVIAAHYYCYPILEAQGSNRGSVRFVGRPDNATALQMLYGWLIDQIRRIATEERRKHFDTTGEHIDPLRWQLHFGRGVVRRLRDRLAEMRARQQEDDASTTALTIHHEAEVSDYFEVTYGWRPDGQPTKADRERQARWAEERAKEEALKAADPEEYYRRYPWERPLTPEQQAEADKRRKAEEARERRNARRREAYIPKGRPGPQWTEEDDRRADQTTTAVQAGRAAADRVNLQPFIEGKVEGSHRRLKR